MGNGVVSPGLYKPSKPRVRAPVDKHIIGYTGNLPGYQNQIEISYSRIARGIDSGELRPKQIELPAGSMGAMSGKMATVHAKPPPEYKLPGYTGYTPQAKYCFEQRYSSVVDAAHAG